MKKKLEYDISDIKIFKWGFLYRIQICLVFVSGSNNYLKQFIKLYVLFLYSKSGISLKFVETFSR